MEARREFMVPVINGKNMAETKHEKLLSGLTALKWSIPGPLSELYCKRIGAIELFSRV